MCWALFRSRHPGYTFQPLISARLGFLSSWTFRSWEDLNTLTTFAWYAGCERRFTITKKKKKKSVLKMLLFKVLCSVDWRKYFSLFFPCLLSMICKIPFAPQMPGVAHQGPPLLLLRPGGYWERGMTQTPCKWKLVVPDSTQEGKGQWCSLPDHATLLSNTKKIEGKEQ